MLTERRDIDYSFLAVAKSTAAFLKRNPLYPVYALAGQPVAFSLEPTYACPLNCEFCYEPDKTGEKDPSKEDFLTELDQKKIEYPGVDFAVWVGGEPTLKQDVLKEGIKRFGVNWIVTNGTRPIEEEGEAWPRIAFFVSVHGLEEAHNAIVRPTNPNLNAYRKAMKTVNDAKTPFYVHTVITEDNFEDIEHLVREWREETRVKGFMFSCATPTIVMPRTNEVDRIQKREEIVKKLLQLKKTHGGFVLMTDNDIKNLLPSRQEKVFGRNCRLKNIVVSFDPKFNEKRPCVMGASMDCGRCGCGLNAMSTGLAGMKTMSVSAKS